MMHIANPRSFLLLDRNNRVDIEEREAGWQTEVYSGSSIINKMPFTLLIHELDWYKMDLVGGN